LVATGQHEDGAHDTQDDESAERVRQGPRTGRQLVPAVAHVLLTSGGRGSRHPGGGATRQWSHRIRRLDGETAQVVALATPSLLGDALNGRPSPPSGRR